MTWWSQPAELEALDALLAVHARRHPDADVVVTLGGPYNVMKESVRQRSEEGSPPSGFQENLGGPVVSWVNAEPAELELLTDTAELQGWADAFPASVLDQVRWRGEIVGVPLALTRQNNVYYAKPILDQLGLALPETLAELPAWLQTLASAGYEQPLCIGDKNTWVSAHVLFDELMPALAGVEYHVAFWHGEQDPGDREISEALNLMVELAPYLNSDFAEIDWAEGVGRVLDDSLPPARRCVMTPMGDWAGSHLTSLNYVPDRDFVQASFPGPDVFVLGGDAFLVPAGAPALKATFDLIETMASLEGQEAFNAAKGSLPARPEVSDAAFSVLARQNLDSLQRSAVGGHKVVAAGESAMFVSLGQAARQMMIERDASLVLDVLEEHYSSLKH